MVWHGCGRLAWDCSLKLHRKATDRAHGYETVLDLYRRRIEKWAGSPDPDYRGIRGMVHVQSGAEPYPFRFAVLKSAESVGRQGRQRLGNGRPRQMEDP